MKFNSSGVRQWTQQFGTSENDVVWGSDTDSKGNIYITVPKEVLMETQIPEVETFFI